MLSGWRHWDFEVGNVYKLPRVNTGHLILFLSILFPWFLKNPPLCGPSPCHVCIYPTMQCTGSKQIGLLRKASAANNDVLYLLGRIWDAFYTFVLCCLLCWEHVLIMKMRKNVLQWENALNMTVIVKGMVKFVYWATPLELINYFFRSFEKSTVLPFMQFRAVLMAFEKCCPLSM